MSERRTIGQILVSIGRITEDDVSRALEYQRDNGGFFGEALIAIGLVTQEELDYGLASQFDLPYVFPDADAVDPDAAALVSPDWALSNMTIPILVTDSTVQVLTDSPLKEDPLEELRGRTSRDVEVALASPAAIRDLIRQVYARATAADDARRTPVELSTLLDSVLQADATRFGISTRGVAAHGWWDDRGTIRRRPLAGEWRPDLDRVMKPGLSTSTEGLGRGTWDAEIAWGGRFTPVSVRYLSDESGSEVLFVPGEAEPRVERFTPPSPGVASEIELLARSGSARFIVVAEPRELGHEILPHLPSIVLEPSWRSIYVHAEGAGTDDDTFGLAIPDDPQRWSQEIETLRAFRFDVIVVDLEGSDGDWAGSALDVAAVAFLLWNAGEDVQPAYEAGIRWTLRVVRQSDGSLEWSLEPLRP